MSYNVNDFTVEELINIEKIENKFGTDYIMTNKHNMRYQCPYCERIRGKFDNDFKLVIDCKTSLYYCFKCKSKGLLIKTKQGYGEKLLSFLIDYFEVDSREKYIKEENILNTELLLFNDVEKIRKNSIAYDYLKERNITNEHIEFYNIHNGINNNLGRIMIPNLLLVKWTDFYQGRTYLDIDPKYKNPDNVEKERIVFNLHNQKKYQKRIYIVEGVFSAILGGKDCISTYGSDISKIQLKLINNYKFEEIICCYDGDSAGQIGNKKLANELVKNNKNVYIVKMPVDNFGKSIDSADMGEYKFKEYCEKNMRKFINNKFESIFGYFDY